MLVCLFVCGWGMAAAGAMGVLGGRGAGGLAKGCRYNGPHPVGHPVAQPPMCHFSVLLFSVGELFEASVGMLLLRALLTVLPLWCPVVGGAGSAARTVESPHFFWTPPGWRAAK
jgi:hypothetical protein